MNSQPGRVFLRQILQEHNESRSTYRRGVRAGLRLSLRRDPKGRAFLTQSEAQLQASAVLEGLDADAMRAVVAKLLELREPVRQALDEFRRSEATPCA